MTKTSIPPSLRRCVLAEAIAYCHTMAATTGAQPVIDHISPESAGGATGF